MSKSVEYNLKSLDFATSFMHTLSLPRVQFNILQFAGLLHLTDDIY